MCEGSIKHSIKENFYSPCNGGIMTKEQAIKILDQAVSQVQTTRQNHQVIIAALEYLATLEEKKE